MYLPTDKQIWVGTADSGKTPVYLRPDMANRHGLIAGATGTGKTVSLKVLAESFSDAGVPVFLVDIKGDVSGLIQPGVENKNVTERVTSMNIPDWHFSGFPVRFWDVYGEKGTPIRTTISDIGPDLLARIMELNDTQTAVLKLIFRIADDQQLLLIDVKDLRAMVQFVGDHAADFTTNYGHIATASIGAIQRAIINLEGAGGDIFFGEPELDVNDWFALTSDGRGMINLLHAVKLVQSPLLYSTFLLWMLSEIYEMLPEAGDLEKPKFVFFFDEAHLLFKDAPKALLDKVEQVVRLVRSKGVGIYFITQQPGDIPDTVLAQLGNKIQHALRAYTPNEQKAIKAAAQSFRENPAFDTETTLTELGTGEALVSFLDEKGTPSIVQRAVILPPQSFMGVADEATIQQMIRGNGLDAKYRLAVDNTSAFETLTEKQAQEAEAQRLAEEEAQRQKEAEKQAKEKEKAEAAAAKQKEKEEAAAKKEAERQAKELQKAQEKLAAQKQKEKEKAEAKKEREKEKAAARRTKYVDRVVGNALSSIGRNLGSSILRGIFGTRKK